MTLGVSQEASNVEAPSVILNDRTLCDNTVTHTGKLISELELSGEASKSFPLDRTHLIQELMTLRDAFSASLPDRGVQPPKDLTHPEEHLTLPSIPLGGKKEIFTFLRRSSRKASASARQQIALAGFCNFRDEFCYVASFA
jgi:hypothetical protein